jgi:hypothetical protein
MLIFDSFMRSTWLVDKIMHLHHDLQVRATDNAGNLGNASTFFPFTVDEKLNADGSLTIDLAGDTEGKGTSGLIIGIIAGGGNMPGAATGGNMELQTLTP